MDVEEDVEQGMWEVVVMPGRQRGLAAGLLALGAGVGSCAVLGPLVLGVLRYRTSDLALTQIRGGDAAALAVVAPFCAVVAVLAWRGHRAAPALALAPAIHALYMYSQLVMGNEYLRAPGNVERFFPLLVAVLVVAEGVALKAWTLVRRADLPATSRRFDRVVGVVLLLLAAYVALGIHGATYVDAVRERPADPQYLGAPTAFWAVKLWDLGVVVPAAVAVGAGMLRGRAWARRAVFPIVGGYLLLGCSVAGMAWTMYASGDPGGSLAGSLVATAAVVAMLGAAVPLYRPVLRAAPPAALPGDARVHVVV